LLIRPHKFVIPTVVEGPAVSCICSKSKVEVFYSELSTQDAGAFSLLVYTGRPASTQLFLKKRRTSLPWPVQSRSENALGAASLPLLG
jgi:hypothetical protein